jgi:23S rRNA pseudouridine2605 synthase
MSKKGFKIHLLAMKQRLNKIIAEAGVCSRRKADELIRAGKVSVNGEMMPKLGSKADREKDLIEVDGVKLTVSDKKRYILFYKPANCLSTVYDPKGRLTVLDFIPQVKERVYPAGRLDWDAEGLLVLTNDGEFCKRVIHPRYRSPKIYRVKVKGVPPVEKVEQLRKGIIIDGRKTAPASVTFLKKDKNCWFRVVLYEGRKNQIKVMFRRIGHPVMKLKRVAISFFNIKGLKPGDYRELTPAEVKRFINQSEVRNERAGT